MKYKVGKIVREKLEWDIKRPYRELTWVIKQVNPEYGVKKPYYIECIHDSYDELLNYKGVILGEKTWCTEILLTKTIRNNWQINQQDHFAEVEEELFHV